MVFHLTEYLERTVNKYPNRVAVIDNEEQINFEQLVLNAKKIALDIVSIDKAVNQVIAVYLDKSIYSVTADIGVLYSANAFMNLDVHSPVERIANVVATVKPKIIISESKYKNALAALCQGDKSIIIIYIDELLTRDDLIVSNDDEQVLFSRIDKLIDTDPAIVVTTSGSTGTPKAVVLNHKSYIGYTEWAVETHDLSDNEVIGCLSPIVFDHHNVKLCLMMAKASTLVLIPKSYPAFPVKIMELMHKHQFTFIFWVPTLMVNIANKDLLSKFEFPSLRNVWFAGEVFPTRQFNYWRKHLPHATFVNLYGPVEITVDCTYFVVNRDISDDQPIPIGKAFRNVDVFLLNEDDKLCQQGEEGEICVRGSCLSMGYYNNPDKTSNVFVQNPLNENYPELIYRTGDIAYQNEYGEYVFKGRKDTLIKHSGYRIELSEIEHIVLNDLKLVKNACVLYDYASKQLVLFYENDVVVANSEFRSALVTLLPKYMIPTMYHKIEELPRNATGKIDRLSLKNRI